MLCHPVRIVGPAELKSAEESATPLIWTVSKAPADWQRELSPFYLGPVELYGGYEALCMENAWQYAKVYAQHLDGEGNPGPGYWKWAKGGWSKEAVRYPMGKGAKPAYLWWDGEKLGYGEARRRVYWRLYQEAVRKTAGFTQLQALHSAGPVALFDFDGYDNDYRKMSLRDVAHNESRPMGHAFVLKAMLLYGPDVQPSQLDATFEDESKRFTPESSQGSLF